MGEWELAYSAVMKPGEGMLLRAAATAVIALLLAAGSMTAAVVSVLHPPVSKYLSAQQNADSTGVWLMLIMAGLVLFGALCLLAQVVLRRALTGSENLKQ